MQYHLKPPKIGEGSFSLELLNIVALKRTFSKLMIHKSNIFAAISRAKSSTPTFYKAVFVFEIKHAKYVHR